MARRLGVFAIVWLVAVIALIRLAPAGQAASWDPVDPKELALTKPLVDKDADAEAILWEVRVTDEMIGDYLRSSYEHYLRIKIFTDRGREQQSRVDIPHIGSVRVRDVSGRTIKRDGTTIELKSSDIFERDLVRTSGLRLKATSFVLPAVEVGGLIEYRWLEVEDDVLSQNMRLPFSREIPVQLVRYHLQPLPLSGTNYTLKGMPFHANPTPLVREGPSRFMTTMSNVRAYPEEPRAPSEWEIRPWLLIYYDTKTGITQPAAFWKDFSKEMFKAFRKVSAPSAEIRRAVSALVAPSATPEEKLNAALAFSRSSIKRVDVDTVSEAEKRGFKRNESATQALQNGRGTGMDVTQLFVAAASVLGLDARMALFPSRADAAFDPGMMLPQMMREAAVAVKFPEGWRFYDPANTYSSTGHLRWAQEAQQGIITDDQDLVVGKTSAAEPEWSTRKRTASLVLSEEGTLEGDVTVEYSGHLGAACKEQDDHLAAAERAKALTEMVGKRLQGAELTAIAIDNVTDAGKPYTTAYHIKVPGYAQKTGSRLFLQPLVFEKGVESEFTAQQRTQPVFFDYAWRELDEIRIMLPRGFDIEASDRPNDLQFGRFAGYKVTLRGTADGSWIELKREFFFGGEQRLSFPQEFYPQLKRFFDEVAKADARTLTLRRAATAGQPLR